MPEFCQFLIPTKNRHPALARTLTLIQRTGASVLLCDQSPQPYAGTVPGTTGRVRHRPELGGLPAARNVLLAEATSEIVVFLDDDTDVAPDFAEALGRCVARWPDSAGWGPVLETRPARIRRLHRCVHLGCFHDPRRLTGTRLNAPTSALFGACFAVRRDIAQTVGFDARRPGYALGEDLDFYARVREHTGILQPFRFCRDLKAHHRRDGANRADPAARGRAKAAFLIWWARRHGGRNPFTLVHLALALAVAGSGHGQEPGSLRGVLQECWAWCLSAGRRPSNPNGV